MFKKEDENLDEIYDFLKMYFKKKCKEIPTIKHQNLVENFFTLEGSFFSAFLSFIFEVLESQNQKNNENLDFLEKEIEQNLKSFYIVTLHALHLGIDLGKENYDSLKTYFNKMKETLPETNEEIDDIFSLMKNIEGKK